MHEKPTIQETLEPRERKISEDSRQLTAWDPDLDSANLQETKFLQHEADMKEVDRIMGLVREIPENSEEVIFSPGEQFDPHEELSKIRIGSKDENKKNLEIFKKKLIFQKKGIIEIQGLLYQEIGNNNEITAEQLKLNIADFKEKYALSDNQRLIFDSAIDTMIQRHEGIVENTQDCIREDGSVDGEKLFAKIFKKQPLGKVVVDILPCTIYLKTYNLQDYTYVHSSAYAINGLNINDSDVQNANRSGGVRLGDSQYPGLESVVTLQNATTMYKRLFSNKILIHEDQHNFNNIINHALDAGETDITLNDKEDIIEFKRRKANERDILIEVRAADEICAYLKDGSNMQRIHDFLLGGATIYEYGEDYKQEEKKFGQQFSQEYIDIVDGGIVAIFDLLKNGYSREAAIAALFPETLTNWGKVTSRLLNKKKTFAEEQRDRKNIVSLMDRIDRAFIKYIRK